MADDNRDTQSEGRYNKRGRRSVLSKLAGIGLSTVGIAALSSPIYADGDQINTNFDPSSMNELYEFKNDFFGFKEDKQLKIVEELSDEQVEAFIDLNSIQKVEYKTHQTGTPAISTEEERTRAETASEVDYKEKWGWDRSELRSDLIESKDRESSVTELDTDIDSTGTQFSTTLEPTDPGGFTLFEWRHVIQWDYDNIDISVSNGSHYDQVLYTDLGWTYEGVISEWDSTNSNCGCIYTGYIKRVLRGMSQMVSFLSAAHTHMLSWKEITLAMGSSLMRMWDENL